MNTDDYSSRQDRKTSDEHIPHIPPAAFDCMTKYYDAITELFGFGKNFKRRVLDMLEAKDGETLLDVGSGTGTLLACAARALPHSQLIGVDPDHGALAIAKRKVAPWGSRVTLHEASAENLPLADETVHVCVSTLAFHHMPQSTKIETIKEIRRVLKREGRFLLVDFGTPKSILSSVLLLIGSLVDGRENLRANLEGVLPVYLENAGFTVSEIREPYRGVRFLLAKKQNT